MWNFDCLLRAQHSDMMVYEEFNIPNKWFPNEIFYKTNINFVHLDFVNQFLSAFSKKKKCLKLLQVFGKNKIRCEHISES